jgi:hypothetical protein
MPHKRMIVFISLSIVAVIAMVLALLPSMSDRDVTPEDYELLKPGMSQAEAERLLHGPPRNDLRYRAIIWLPQATGKRISAGIAPVTPAIEFFAKEEIPKNGRQGLWVTQATDFFPQVTTKSGHQGVWITRTGLIAVYFGPDGRLQHKYSSMVDEGVPHSILGWLTTRPRMIRRSLGF